ncbi:MAG: efflux RND transporter periplasmic adaptor subunit [Planctomycetota bacterium]
MRSIPLVMILALACGEKKQMQATAPPPPKVTVATPVRQDLTEYVDVTGGRTRGTEIVQIRARVTGFLEKMHYKPGETVVKEGDLLFTIEKDDYQAQVEQAKANLASAEASLEKAISDLARFEEALKSNAVSQVQVTQAKAEKLAADAAVMSAKATLKRAELELSYCDVRSPIAGFPGRNQVDLGNLVGPNNNALLTTVVKRRPIFVYFDIPEKWVNIALQRRAEMEKDPERKTIVRVKTPDQENYNYEGLVDWVDNSVDLNTGTLRARAVLENDNRVLYSGVFVNVRLQGDVKKDQILIEERAIATDLGGKFVFIVVDNEQGKNIVERRYVTLGQREGKMRHIMKGLDGSERYIVAGGLRARPGFPVDPDAGTPEG